MPARSPTISGAPPANEANACRLEIEEHLARMACQLETSGEGYRAACRQLAAVDAKLRQPWHQDKRDKAERMHAQMERLHRLAELFPEMSALVLRLRKALLASDDPVCADLLARLRAVDVLLQATLALVRDELAGTKRTLGAMMSS